MDSVAPAPSVLRPIKSSALRRAHRRRDGVDPRHRRWDRRVPGGSGSGSPTLNTHPFALHLIHQTFRESGHGLTDL